MNAIERFELSSDIYIDVQASYNLLVRRENGRLNLNLVSAAQPTTPLVQKTLSNKEEESLTDALVNVQIDEWESSYEPEGFVVLDGFTWKLSLKTDDGNIETGGTNSFPVGLRDLCRWLYDLCGVHLWDNTNDGPGLTD